MQELLKALVKAKAAFKPIVKDKQGARAKYATLDSVLSSVEPALHENGLCLVQTTKLDGDSFILETILFHTSGDYLSSTYPLKVDADPQKIGISITYGRRYAVCSLLSVIADEDTDGDIAGGAQGNKAATNGKAPARPSAPAPGPKAPPAPAAPSGIQGDVIDLVTDAIGDGLTREQIVALCTQNNLPAASGDFKTKAQVTTLAQLLQDEIVKLPQVA
jgi:hypothetical protein